MEPSEARVLPTFWELPFFLKRRLIKDFSFYVLKSVRFRHFVMFFSFCALAFQTRRLLATYLEYNTVVKVDIAKPYEINVPGVTICTDKYNMILKSKLEKRYPQITEEIGRSGFNETTEKEKIMDIYRRYRRIAYENSTISQWLQLMVEPQDLLECKLLMNPIWRKERGQKNLNCYDFSPPLWHLPVGVGVCWTFFSQVNDDDHHRTDEKGRRDWYRIDTQLGYVASFRFTFEIFKDMVYDVKPFSYENPEGKPEVGAIINHPRGIYSVVSLDRAALRPGTNFDLLFSQTNAHLLNWPYHTDCRTYEHQGRWKRYKSTYECLDTCITERMLWKCKCLFNHSRNDRITKLWQKGWRKDLRFCPENDSRTDDCATNLKFDISTRKSECRTKGGMCKYNCYEEYYRYEVRQTFWDNETDGSNDTESDDDFFYPRGEPFHPRAHDYEDFATLYIKRKDAMDTTYTHTARMIFVEFVCYFGGLLGLWLGVSILDVYHQCVIWWDEAPGEYEKWLERQQYFTNVETININRRNGNISYISDNLNEYSKRNYNNNKVRDIYATDYETTYADFGTQFK